MESIYRYRFQGTIFDDREGYLSSSDTGASFHYNLPGNYGDIHGGVYNGETYTRPEVERSEGFHGPRHVPAARMSPTLRGLRLTGFYDDDAYVKDAERSRGILAATFEHPYVNAAFDYLTPSDQTRASTAEVDGQRLVGLGHPEDAGQHRLGRARALRSPGAEQDARRAAATGPSSASPTGSRTRALSRPRCCSTSRTWTTTTSPARPDERRYAVHALVNF